MQPFLPEIKTVEINVAAASLFTLSTAVKLLSELYRETAWATRMWLRQMFGAGRSGRAS